MVARDETPLSGDVHVDGAYVGGPVRPENRKEDLVDRRLAENQNPDKRCVLVMRENTTAEERKQGFQGAKRTLARVIEKETQAALSQLAPTYIAAGSMISADESEVYDPLHARYAMRRVNHSQEYRSADSATNRGELLQPLSPDAVRAGAPVVAEIPGPLCPRNRLPGGHPARGLGWLLHKAA